jgi:hypothetical protein
MNCFPLHSHHQRRTRLLAADRRCACCDRPACIQFGGRHYSSRLRKPLSFKRGMNERSLAGFPGGVIVGKPRLFDYTSLHG